jgi:hypothetical protein
MDPEEWTDAINELERRKNDPVWGKTPALLEEHDENRMSKMINFLRANLDQLVSAATA